MSPKTYTKQVLNTLYDILVLIKSLFLYFVLGNTERGVFIYEYKRKQRNMDKKGGRNINVRRKK